MGRPNYVCTTCSEHFTRKYSAKRHIITVHHNYGGGEIVPLVEYLVGRKSGRYQASHPSWHRRPSKETRIHKFGGAMVADSVGEAFIPPGLQRQQQGQYQHQYHQQSLEEQERHHRHEQQSPFPSMPSIPPTAIQGQHPDAPYPTDPAFQSQPMDTTDDEETTTTLSQESILKIAELKRLVYKYPQYHRNPGAVISCVIYFCSEGDNSFLDDKLEQLRSIDAFSKY